MTDPRRAIVAALLDAGGHLTADELLEAAQATQPATVLTTVYRTMDVLAGAGLVEHIHLGHGAAVYHLTDHGHRHLVCEGCGRVVPVGEEELAELTDHIRSRLGFTVDARHFALPGRCADCSGGDTG